MESLKQHKRPDSLKMKEVIRQSGAQTQRVNRNKDMITDEVPQNE